MRKKPFTLLELVTAMAVLLIFMLALMRFFGVAQNAMDSAGAKTDQYERARIAMNLIANDLANIFYSEGTPTLCYAQTDSGNSTTLVSLAVMRNQPVGDSDTALTRVDYKFDNAEHLLKTAVIGQKDHAGAAEAAWNLYADSNNFPTITDTARYTELIDGVKDFALVPSPALTAQRTIPNTVTIELTLYSKKAMDKANNNVFSDAEKAKFLEDDEDAMTFTRIIAIDRGQF